MAPTVSVLLPVWRPNLEWLREAVASIVNQSFPDWELVVVERPSHVAVDALLRSFQDSRIRHYTTPDATCLAEQLNFGLERCQAPVVARQDADDVSLPDRIERQLGFLDEHRSVAVVGSWLEIIDACGQSRGFRRYPTEPEQVRRTLRYYNPIAHPTAMFRREVAMALGGYVDTPVGLGAEDYWLWCRVALAGYSLANVPVPLVRYRLHDSSVKSNRVRSTLRATTWIKRQLPGQRPRGASVRCLVETAAQAAPPRLVYWLWKRTTLRNGPSNP